MKHNEIKPKVINLLITKTNTVENCDHWNRNITYAYEQYTKTVTNSFRTVIKIGRK